MEALLRDAPGNTFSVADMERLDRQATEWLRKQGYDEDGNDMLTMAANEVKEMKGTMVTPDVEVEEDPVGSPTENSYEIIDALITDLEGNDEQLLDIATQAYNLMTEDGQRKLETNGF
jgi:hypothetical protein